MVVGLILSIISWIACCAEECKEENARSQNNSVRSDQIQGQPGQLFQLPSGQIVRVNSAPGRPVDHNPRIQGQPGLLFKMPSGQIVRVNSPNMQPPQYNPEQAGMPGRPVDHDPRVGISPKIGLVDQA